jgi:HAD superfamily hydrolase (TIGR01549 family)
MNTSVKKNLKSVVFDLDDTLLDHQYSSRCGLAALKQEYLCLRRIPLEDLEQENFRLRNELHIESMTGELSLEQVRIERFRRLFRFVGVEVSTETAKTALVHFKRNYQSARRPINGVVALLRKLRAIVKIGVVSNHMVQEQREKLSVCGIDRFVDVLVVSEEVGFAKPDRVIFEVTLDKLNSTATETVMIGDTWETDIIGAHRAGIRPIWLNRYGLTCPDPAMAKEINSYEPLSSVCDLIFDNSETESLLCSANVT